MGKRLEISLMPPTTHLSRERPEGRDARFQMLVEKTRVIAWEASMETWQFTYVSPQAEAILGYPVSDWYTQDFWPKHIHPEDRDRALQFCLESSKTRENYEFEYRMLAAD